MQIEDKKEELKEEVQDQFFKPIQCINKNNVKCSNTFYKI